MKRMHSPPYPGQVLKEYLGDATLAEAAKKLGLEQQTLQNLLEGELAISPEIAAHLATGLGTSVQLWSGMQKQYDLHTHEPAAQPQNQHSAG